MELIVDSIIYTLQKNGGISRLFSELLPRLCDLDEALSVLLLSYSEIPLTQLPQHQRVRRKTIPDLNIYARPYRIWHTFYPEIRKLLIRSQAGGGKGKIWLSTYYTTPMAWRGKQVAIAYDFIHEKYRNLYWQTDIQNADKTIKQKAIALSGADLIICISEATRRDLIELYEIPVHKTAVVHLAHQSTFRVLDVKHKPAKNFILYVGNRNRYKGFDVLLRAFANWPYRYEVNLICAGGGDWSDVEIEQIIHFDLLDQVILFPHVSDDRLCELYNQAVAFIYPSQYEGFGIPLLEAMACRCPVIASGIPSSMEVAQNTPYYFSPGNSGELIIALNQALMEGRASDRCKLGEEFSRTYSWDKTAESFLQALRTIH